MRNLDSCRRLRCMLCPCKLRNKFFINFWNRTILLCIPCIDCNSWWPSMFTPNRSQRQWTSKCCEGSVVPVVLRPYRLLMLVLVLKRLGVTVAGVYRQPLYRHCSEPLEHMAPVDRAAWAKARETVHIYGDTRDGARAWAQVVWTHIWRFFIHLRVDPEMHYILEVACNPVLLNKLAITINTSVSR
jgi:hypothetical protein